MIKLFTHKDLDGVGCAILAQLSYGTENVDIEYCNYSDINERVTSYISNDEYMKYDFCFITDISINENLADYINTTQPKGFKEGFMLNEHFQLLDHHKTALEINKYWWCKVKEFNGGAFKTSGTELFYEWLIINKKLPPSGDIYELVNLVTNYDTWRWVTLGEDGEICKQVNDLYYLYGRDEFIAWVKSQLHDGVFPRLYEKDKLVLKLRQREIDEYIKGKNETMIKTSIEGYRAGVVFADRYQSELGNELCKLNADIDFVAIVNMDKSVSYRTVKEIDLGEIATVFGGGGHPESAGSGINDYIRNKVVRDIFYFE